MSEQAPEPTDDSVPDGTQLPTADDMPDEEEFDGSALTPFEDPRLPTALFLLLCSPKAPPSSMAEIPRAWGVDVRLEPGENTAPSLRICENGAKFPPSSYRHAIKYAPGAAKVEKIQRIESSKLDEILLGITCHPDNRRS